MTFSFGTEGRITDRIGEYLDYLGIVQEVTVILNNEDLDLNESDCEVAVSLHKVDEGLKVSIDLIFSTENE
jgi:hypothetical protein